MNCKEFYLQLQFSYCDTFFADSALDYTNICTLRKEPNLLAAKLILTSIAWMFRRTSSHERVCVWYSSQVNQQTQYACAPHNSSVRYIQHPSIYYIVSNISEHGATFACICTLPSLSYAWLSAVLEKVGNFCVIPSLKEMEGVNPVPSIRLYSFVPSNLKR